MPSKKENYKAASRLEAQVVLILMKAGVIGPDIDACMTWAFGPNIWYLPPYPDWLDRWRKLHPEYPVKKNESFVKWIFVVGWLFVQWKKHQQKLN